MPVTKRDDGYYWGSKGPFKTRGEALKVQRAAHANGYESKGKDKPRRKLSTKMKRGKTPAGIRG